MKIQIDKMRKKNISIDKMRKKNISSFNFMKIKGIKSNVF